MTLTKPHLPVIACAGCNIFHVAPQTRDLATHGPDRVFPIPDQHRNIEVMLRSIREDGGGWFVGKRNTNVSLHSPSSRARDATSFMLRRPLPVIPCAVQHPSCCAADTGSCHYAHRPRASDPGSAPRHSVSPRSRSRAPRRLSGPAEASDDDPSALEPRQVSSECPHPGPSPLRP